MAPLYVINFHINILLTLNIIFVHNITENIIFLLSTLNIERIIITLFNTPHTKRKNINKEDYNNIETVFEILDLKII